MASALWNIWLPEMRSTPTLLLPEGLQNLTIDWLMAPIGVLYVGGAGGITEKIPFPYHLYTWFLLILMFCACKLPSIASNNEKDDI